MPLLRETPQVAILLFLTLGACTAVAAPASARKTDLAQLKTRFQQRLDRLRDQVGFPGATAAFMFDEDRLVGIATGFEDIEEGLPMRPEKRMLSASVGKTFVAAVALSLWQEGKLDLDDRLSKWFGDEGWFERLPNRDDITLRMLLSHSSGIPDHVYSRPFQIKILSMMAGRGRDDRLAPTQLVGYILDAPPLFPAGKGWAYSDTGFILAGLIIEKASGSTYYEELQKRFLTPLGLTLTGPSIERRIEGLSQGYLPPHNNPTLPHKVLDGGAMVLNPSIEWTGGGLATNSRDLVRWAKALYEGKALSKPYLDELLKTVPRKEGRPDGYGLGVFVNDTRWGKSYGHVGWFPGYKTNLGYFPDHRVAIAIQMNTDASMDLRAILEELAEAILETGERKDPGHSQPDRQSRERQRPVQESPR